ncbi:MAG: SpoVT / AbrB like domain protein [Candidatus Bathyarchaeota archaeon BA2]|nr:MAG: SpoVT / AbrB like domain protein [Candidatus Bathyarchaeota archaeon BA2]
MESFRTTISNKGLVTIPSVIRERLNLQRGDKLEWHITRHGEETLIQVRVIRNAYALLKGKRRDSDLAYEKIEHLADEALLREIQGHADSRS